MPSIDVTRDGDIATVALNNPGKLNAPPAAPLTPAEIDANFDYFDTEDYRIGYDAFINKQEPKFKGR